MKRSDILSYLYDFLSLLSEQKDFTEYVRQVILFGSVARGDFDDNSDIDVFFDAIDEKNANELLEISLKSWVASASKKWKLKGIEFDIKPLIGDLNDERWQNLKGELISYGIVLYGKYETTPQEIKHYALINFDASQLERKDKMKLLRALCGYKNEKKKKTYTHKGLIHEINGSKIASNAFLIPIQQVQKAKQLLRRFRLTLKISEVWTKP